MEGELTREWHTDRRVHLRSMLAVVRRGGGDPTWLDEGAAGFWKGWRTPSGPVAVHLSEDSAAGVVRARAWGPGADWVLDGLPGLLGEDDDCAEFAPAHPPVAAAWRRYAGLRVPRTRLVVESLVPAIIEQKVTGREAFAAYRFLVRRHGVPAPGPAGERGLMCAPDAAGWAAVPSWDWLKAGVDAHRADTAVAAVRHAGRLEALAELPAAVAREKLRTLLGIGRWTAAEVAHVALGDADAVSFGDYHIAANMGWWLTGEVTDDAGMARLLEPYDGHRYRVQRLLELSGVARPRHGARRTLPTHLPR